MRINMYFLTKLLWPMFLQAVLCEVRVQEITYKFDPQPPLDSGKPGCHNATIEMRLSNRSFVLFGDAQLCLNENFTGCQEMMKADTEIGEASKPPAGSVWGHVILISIPASLLIAIIIIIATFMLPGSPLHRPQNEILSIKVINLKKFKKSKLRMLVEDGHFFIDAINISSPTDDDFTPVVSFPLNEGMKDRDCFATISSSGNLYIVMLRNGGRLQDESLTWPKPVEISIPKDVRHLAGFASQRSKSLDMLAEPNHLRDVPNRGYFTLDVRRLTVDMEMQVNKDQHGQQLEAGASIHRVWDQEGDFNPPEKYQSLESTYRSMDGRRTSLPLPPPPPGMDINQEMGELEAGKSPPAIHISPASPVHKTAIVQTPPTDKSLLHPVKEERVLHRLPIEQILASSDAARSNRDSFLPLPPPPLCGTESVEELPAPPAVRNPSNLTSGPPKEQPIPPPLPPVPPNLPPIPLNLRSMPPPLPPLPPKVPPSRSNSLTPGQTILYRELSQCSDMADYDPSQRTCPSIYFPPPPENSPSRPDSIQTGPPMHEFNQNPYFTNSHHDYSVPTSIPVSPSSQYSRPNLPPLPPMPPHARDPNYHTCSYHSQV